MRASCLPVEPICDVLGYGVTVDFVKQLKSVAGVKLKYDRTKPGLFHCHEYLVYTLAVFADRVVFTGN